MVAHYRQRQLPDGEYFVIGLVEHTSQGGQGDIEYRWTWLCKNPQSQPVLLTEIYDISWWAVGGPSTANLTAQHLCEVTEEVLTQQTADLYRSKLKHVCNLTLPLPIFIRFSDVEKNALCR